MKKLLSTLLLFTSIYAFGQTVPQGINYQAVALDQNGQPIRGVDIVGRPIVDAEIGVRLTILENSPTGMVLYQEEHEVLTDLYGMFNLVIGQGLQVSSDPFNSINWQGDKYLQVELSIDNNGSFTLSAVQQLMSVPYAFLAENALVAQTAIDVDDADADPTNELQGLSLSNDTLYLSNGGFVVLPTDQVNDADSDPTNELQILSLSNDTIYLASGGFVVLPTDQVNDADDNPTNEIQTLSKTGSTISLTQGGNVTVFDGDYNALSNTPTIPTKTSDLTNDSGFITAEVDGSTTNEIQTLSKTGNTISLTQGGSVTVFDGDYNSLTSIPTLPTKTSDLTNDSGFITSEVDGSTTNEIQTLSKTGNTISLTQGGSVTVFDGDYNSLSNTPTVPTKTSDLTNDSGFITSEVDGSTTNELQVLTISNDTIFLSNGGFVKLPTNLSSSPSNSKTISNEDLGDLFGLQYTGNGSLGDYYSDQNSNVTGKFLNYDDFFLFPGDTFDLPSSTTILFVQDTCYLGGVVNGQKSGTNYRNLTYNTSSSNWTTYNGLQAASGTNNTSSNYTGTPRNFREGIHTVKWDERALLKYLYPYQSTVSGLNNDTSFMICAAQFGEISGQDGGSGGTSYGAYGGYGGKGLIIITKTLIIENAIFDLRGKSGTNSPNTSYAGGAGGGGSLFISYEDGSIQNPYTPQTGGSALSVYTTTPLTNGANGRVLFYQR
jgi:hypothetical protein